MFSQMSAPRSIFVLWLLCLFTACQPATEQTATRPTKEPPPPPTVAATTPMIPTATPTTVPTQAPTALPTATQPTQPGRIMYLAAPGATETGFSTNDRGEVYMLTLDSAGEAIGEPVLVPTDDTITFGPLVSSPDGSRVLVIGKTEGADIVTLVYPNSNQIVTGVLSGSGSRFFHWFPDNRRIIVRIGDKDLQWMDVGTGEYFSFFGGVDGFDPDTGAGFIGSAAISPDGQTIIYAQEVRSGYQIWMMNSDGNNRRLVWDVEVVSSLTWSPDGQLIAFSGGIGNEYGVIVMNADGSNPRSVSHNFSGGHAYPVMWSPDSRRLAFNGVESPHPILDSTNYPNRFRNTLYVVDVLTGEERVLLPDGTGSADPAWSPDGQQLVFASYRSGDSEIWAVNVDGSHLRQLTHQDGLVRFPVWLPAVP